MSYLNEKGNLYEAYLFTRGWGGLMTTLVFVGA